MGSVTGYTRRTANIGSGAGGGAAIKTIYTDNDTIDNQVRDVSLYGNTSSDKLIFQNLAGNDLLTLYGDKSIDLGSAAMAIENERHYFSASSGACTFYRNSATYLTIDPANYNTTFLGTASQGIAILSNQGQVYAVGPTASFASYNTSGNKKADIGITGNGGFLSLFNSAGSYIFAIDANSAVAGIIGDFGIGAFGPYSARLDVKGIGTASGLTALFKNSSSVNSLKIRDDNYVIQRAINGAILDADLSNNEMSAYIDETTSFLIFKVKTSAGVVKTASIALV